MSGLDFTDRESQIIGMMLKAGREMPDEFWCVPAVQSLAVHLAKFEALMTEEEAATIVGIGAMLSRQGNAEMKAEIQAIMALGRARTRR